jgi:hypothetical protein
VLSKKVGCTARYTVSISEGVATVKYLEPQHTAACLALKQRTLPADARENVSALFETGLRVPVHDALKLNWDAAERKLAAEWDCSEEEVRERLLANPGLAPRASTISAQDVQNIKRRADEAAWKLHNNELVSLEEHLRRHAEDVVLYQPQELDVKGNEVRACERICVPMVQRSHTCTRPFRR